MCFLHKLKLLASLLFVVLALSFLWCMIDNIWRSAQAAQTGDVMLVTASTVLVGYLWLVGHGIHGAAVIALPAILIRRTQPHNDLFSWEQELDVWLQN